MPRDIWKIPVPLNMQLPDILPSQKRLAEFLYVDRSTVTKHLKNIFAGEGTQRISILNRRRNTHHLQCPIRGTLVMGMSSRFHVFKTSRYLPASASLLQFSFGAQATVGVNDCSSIPLMQ